MTGVYHKCQCPLFKQFTTILDYTKASYTYKGIAEGKAKRDAEGVQTPQEAAAEHYYNTGYEDANTDELRSDINMAYNDARQKLVELIGEDAVNDIDNDPLAMQAQYDQDMTVDDNTKFAIASYVSAKSAWDGVQQRISDDAADRADQRRTEGERMAYKGKGDMQGMLRPITINEESSERDPETGKTVYLVNGTIAIEPNGNGLSREGTDKTIYVYDPETGDTHELDPFGGAGVLEVGDVVSMDDYLAQNEQQSQAEVQQAAETAQGKVKVNTPFITPQDRKGTVQSIEGDNAIVLFADGEMEEASIPLADMQQYADALRRQEYEARHPQESGVNGLNGANGETSQPNTATEGQAPTATAETPTEGGNATEDTRTPAQRTYDDVVAKLGADRASKKIDATAKVKADRLAKAQKALKTAQETADNTEYGSKEEQKAEEAVIKAQAEYDAAQQDMAAWDEVRKLRDQALIAQSVAEDAARKAERDRRLAEESEAQRKQREAYAAEQARRKAEAEAAEKRRQEENERLRQQAAEAAANPQPAEPKAPIEGTKGQASQLEIARQELADDPEALAMLDETEPRTLVEVAATLLASGKNATKLLREDFKRETGYSDADVKRYPFLFAGADKGGITLARFGEMVVEAAREYDVQFDENDATAGIEAALELLGSVGSQGDINNYIAGSRIQQAYDYHNAALAAARANMLEAYGMTEGEYESYMSWLEDAIEQGKSTLSDEEFNQIFNVYEQGQTTDVARGNQEGAATTERTEGAETDTDKDGERGNGEADAGTGEQAAVSKAETAQQPKEEAEGGTGTAPQPAGGVPAQVETPAAEQPSAAVGEGGDKEPKKSGKNIADVEAGGAVVDKLEKMGVEVSADIAENRRVRKQAENDKSENGKIHELRTTDGKVYGFAYRGKLYLDPRKIDAELPLHEYAHLWTEAMRMLNPKKWAEVVEQIKQDKDAWQFIQSTYPDLKTDSEIADEVIATFSGKNGAEKLKAALDRFTQNNPDYKSRWNAIFNSIAKALQDFWKAVGDFLNIKYESAEQVYDQVLKDFVSGMNPRARVEKYLQERETAYMQAAERGDVAKATEIFNQALSEEIGNGMTPFIAVGRYDRASRIPTLAHKVKSRDPKAIDEVAELIAPIIPKNAVLVPAPSHNGRATDMLDLAKAIAKRTGSEVADVLTSAPRDSQYETKKRGGLIASQDMGITMTGTLPEGKIPVVIDNVVGSGNTAEACVRAIGKGLVVSLGDAADRYNHAVSLKSAAPILRDRNNNIVPLSKRFNLGGSQYLGRSAYERANGKAAKVSAKERKLRDAIVDLLRKAGIEVVTESEEGQRVLDMANGKGVTLNKAQKRALKTVSISDNQKHRRTVVSSADGAKIQKNLDTLAEKIEKISQTPLRTFIGDLAKALGAEREGSGSEYAFFTTPNGEDVTIRLANHNATVSNFDYRNEDNGISVVIAKSRDTNSGINNDGKAHVVEYYYTETDLRKAFGKPLADIVRSIKGALNSGEFVDTTGLAEREEVNAGNVRFFRTENGEAYGFTMGGKIYLDPKVATAETPIHEYTHLWAAALRAANPKAWERLKSELTKDTELMAYVQRLYPELAGSNGANGSNGLSDELAEEVFAHFSGRRGAERLREEQRKAMDEASDYVEKAGVVAMFERLRDALRRFWNMARDLFAGKTRGIKSRSAEDFADMVLADLVGGFKPDRVDRNDRERDVEYMEAVNSGDMEKAQRDKEYAEAVAAGDKEKIDAMLREEMRRKGYGDNSDYQGSLAFNGAAPSSNAYFETREERKEAFDEGELEGDFSLGDFMEAGIDTHDLEWQLANPIAASARDKATLESINNLRSAVRGKKKTIKMYRAVPADLKEGSFRNGDWVTPSRKYAEQHIELQDWEGGRIIEQEVSVDDIWWNGDDINEWGFDDGKGYAYKNTENNRKLMEPTYDDNGNLIPLSERFTDTESDVRFRGEEREREGGEEANAGEWYDRNSVERIGEFAGYTPKRIAAMNARQEESARNKFRDAAEKLHLSDNITFADTLDDVPGLTDKQRKAWRRKKGWYSPRTGKIVIILGNHRSMDDVMKSIMHEGVAHHGLRQMFGKHFDTFLDNVYQNAHESIHDEIYDMAKKHGWNFREATEEYLAKLAEDTDFEKPENQSWWKQVKAWFFDMLHKIGFKLHDAYDTITDNELRYILWRSYENLVNPGRFNSVVEEAKDIAKQYDLKVGQWDETWTVAAEEEPNATMEFNGRRVPIWATNGRRENREDRTDRADRGNRNDGADRKGNATPRDEDRMFADAVAKIRKEKPNVMIMKHEGDFYVIEGEDAKKAANLLGYEMSKVNGIDAVAFPAYLIDEYLPKLVGAGVKVAIADNVAADGVAEIPAKWNNRGYTMRDNGQAVSVRGLQAEEEGRFPKGTFMRVNHMPKETFDSLKKIGAIVSGEWHHTGKAMNKTPYFGWLGENEDAEAYAQHKAEIDKICQELGLKEPYEYENGYSDFFKVFIISVNVLFLSNSQLDLTVMVQICRCLS